ncbi:NAD(P)/FAD-dependent oxidoreductase [Saccharopolyspora spinosa]|uniref:NAD(P)/FAD-dependent oxidoreductase n=1 Tax=Saccharopolyspora spinosa TaxID=60894 RepID=UPI000237A4B7|nr:FAD-dependent oxidoreductase [Saccharopolyspora spinosa]
MHGKEDRGCRRGIVGTSIAAQLPEDVSVTVLDQGASGRLQGSTGLAPGFVGPLNEVPVSTELARASAELYDDLELDGVRGFDRVGGVEVASTPEIVAKLGERAELAARAGLPHGLLDTAETVALAPELIDPANCSRGLHYTQDGTARAGIITAALRKRNRARFVDDAAVVGIELRGNRVASVRTTMDSFPPDDVVVSSGIWGPVVASLVDQRIPLTSVTHPYVYGPKRADPRCRRRSYAGPSSTSTRVTKTIASSASAPTTTPRSRCRSTSSAESRNNRGPASCSTTPSGARWNCCRRHTGSPSPNGSARCSR